MSLDKHVVTMWTLTSESEHPKLPFRLRHISSPWNAEEKPTILTPSDDCRPSQCVSIFSHQICTVEMAVQQPFFGTRFSNDVRSLQKQGLYSKVLSQQKSFRS